MRYVVPLDESGNIDLLERIVTGQRDILANVFHKNASDVPQMWCLYKEVQGYYVSDELGMRGSSSGLSFRSVV